MKNGVKLVNANRYKKYCYIIPISFIVDYKEQDVIIDFKVNI